MIRRISAEVHAKQRCAAAEVAAKFYLHLDDIIVKYF